MGVVLLQRVVNGVYVSLMNQLRISVSLEHSLVRDFTSVVFD